jgi:putative ABC transport system ATP-binding protein
VNTASTSGQSGAPVISGQDLVLRFGSTEALRGISVSIDRGEVLAVVGPSGSGKSSLLHCIACILAPTSGHVHLGRRRIDNLGDHALSEIRLRQFGFVFQFGELIPELSLLENVALPLRFQGTKRAPASRTARDMLDDLGIGDLADRRPAQVSGGQLQRGAIARALVHRPSVVFADEPTGALDSATGVRVLDVLCDERLRGDTSVVLVTHDMNVARRADRVISVRDGLVASPQAPASTFDPCSKAR